MQHEDTRLADLRGQSTEAVQGPGRRASPLLVEFVGLPGAGKSTVRLRVIDQLTELGYRCVPDAERSARALGKPRESAGHGRSPRRRAVRLLRYARTHASMARGVTTAYAYLLLHGELTRNRLRMVRTLFHAVNRIRAGYLEAQKQRADVVIHDQGIGAYLRQIMTDPTPPAERRWARLASTLGSYLPRTRRVAVVLEVDPQIALGRIQGRPVEMGRWDRLAPAKALQELTPQHQRLDTMLQSLLDAQAIDALYRVGADRPVEEVARDVASRLIVELRSRAGEDLERRDC